MNTERYIRVRMSEGELIRVGTKSSKHIPVLPGQSHKKTAHGQQVTWNNHTQSGKITKGVMASPPTTLQCFLACE